MHYNLRKKVNKQFENQLRKRKTKNKNLSENKSNTPSIQMNDNNKMSKLSASLDAILRALPNFDGENYDNINTFITQYDELVKDADINDKVKLILLKSKFSGNARDLIYNTPDLNDEKDYGVFKTIVINYFKKQIFFAQSQSKFMELQQKPDQTIEEFVKYFNVAAVKYLKDSGHANNQGAKDFLNIMKLTKFIDSVRPEIAFQIKIAEPKTFEEAVNMARKVELALKTSPESVNNMTIQNPVETSIETKTNTKDIIYETLLHKANKQEAEMEKIHETLNNLSLKKQTTDSDKKLNRYCHICKTKTHDTDTCWYNSKYMGSNHVNSFKPQTYRQHGTQNNAENFNMCSNNSNFMDRQQPSAQMTQQNYIPQQRSSENYGYIPFQPPQTNYSHTGPVQQMMHPNNSNYAFQQNPMPYSPPQNFQHPTGGAQNFVNNTPQFNTQQQNSYRRPNRGRYFRSGRNTNYRNRTFTPKNNNSQPRITYPQGN